ncbi:MULTISPECIES: enoyl-CoA hydratase/isomerase family protein [unclassified Rhodococcus (in: high G+C Gram-positive bacteria)]|uniref:enoyl-CoA hydratase/isomerase family protein n=1 Tax=unclassified Rhodococcus (in: high G+C Gram-positive bacteria) TaxID=192944 RepID=UPI000B9B16C5|nr:MULTISPECIES: enoyl-CoA hydratase-related protein [unclassified Rhodococcus (in: high G+C Gram-positive bacteria)]OZE34297.1 enoyl-CoA hydratase [Rhodococcus sp. 05-2254-4]OZE51495.1 enoyl-CoA hydratase [Rhodococcus sp. 05-2254-3]OZE53145.1 enoyl-CoA hydratase [Rhodococcus sp. 05-2254-2]
MTQFVKLQTPEDHTGVGIICIDRPPHNLLSRQVQMEIAAAAEETNRRSDISAVVVYGGPKTLAAGADIKELHSMTSAELRADARRLQRHLGAIADIGKPTVMAITGLAVGAGLELCLGADRRIAAANAKLGLPETKFGIMPGGGGTQRLARLIGPSKAKELIFTGRVIEATEALDFGLVDEVVAPDDVLGTALAWARQFSGAASMAISHSKRAIDLGMEVDLAVGLQIEERLFVDIFDTKDRKNGFQSFIDDGPGRAHYNGD